MILEEKLNYIHQIRIKVAEEIIQAANISSNEAEFRTKFAKIIDTIAEEIGIELRLKEEYTVATPSTDHGRVDAAYNRFIIEYEAPGRLKPNLYQRDTKHAVEQVKDYIEGVAQAERLKIDRLAGVALDGNYFVFVRKLSGNWVIEDPVPVNEHSTERFLRMLFSMVSGAALIPENLIKDFGSQNITAQRVTRKLYESILNTKNELVHKIFEQWQTFFGEVTGYQETTARLAEKKELRAFAKGMGLKPDKVNPPVLFFAVHTYFAILIKMIAWLAVSRYGFKFGSSFATLSTLNSEELKSKLIDMERGGIFRAFGIRNFLEGDFFGWYLHIWDDKIDEAIRSILNKVREYDPATLDVLPEQTRDLLKKLYHYLMPRELRHDLGEYYTPDWLAERLLNMLEAGKFKGDPRKRILDPACGSGTFLVLAIKKIKEYCLNKLGLNEKETLQLILKNVVGIDLNPLAVIAARTNYLLALGELLEHRDTDIDIPIYLADSILTPSLGQDIFTHNTYQIKTSVGTFQIPTVIGNRQRMDKLANLIDECVESGIYPEVFIQRAKTNLNLSEKEFNEAKNHLLGLYNRLFELHQKGQNGIWARIIKNAFMPLFLDKFDYIIGNPPWVNWESLPQEYRDDTKELWIYHGLFPHGGMDTILGKGKKDISMLMAYEVMESFLKDGGKLGFVITQTVFKGTGAAEGFRNFRLGNKKYIQPIFAEDMVSLNPFEGANNRTATMILQKGRKPKYPVSYSLWIKTVKGRIIKFDDDLKTVLRMTKRANLVAEPVDISRSNSTWLTARPKALKALRKILGKSDYVAHEGVNTGGGSAVYWIEKIAERKDGLWVVQNCVEDAKKKVEKIQAALEQDYIFPLLKQKFLYKWHIKIENKYIIMVQDPIKRRGIDEKLLQSEAPKTYIYLKRFEDFLKSRAAFKRYYTRKQGNRIIKLAPFYSMFNVGDYTFEPYKVVWPNMGNRLVSTVISTFENKLILPQHIITLISSYNFKEAHYICSIVNSIIFNFAAKSYSQAGGKSFGDPHILDNIRIAKFNSDNYIHLTLAELSIEAHKNYDNEHLIKKIENEIDLLVAKLYGITEDELKDIYYNFEDLY